jgi:4-hydroxysphinganine ceramide fatty acyl 2-hydroxylase
MATNNIKVKGQAKLFDSKLAEALTRTHPAYILCMYIPFGLYLLWYFYTNVEPSLTVTLGLFGAGVFFWTFAEYMLHRYVFHWVSENVLVKRVAYLVHGVHHEYPKDKQRLLMPPIPSMILAAVFFGFFKVILGSFAFAFFSGFLIGYLVYAMIHYSTHAFRPPQNAFKFLWTYHSLHHFKCPDKAYGVSTPLWDYVFGTVPPKK